MISNVSLYGLIASLNAYLDSNGSVDRSYVRALNSLSGQARADEMRVLASDLRSAAHIAEQIAHQEEN